MIGLDATLVVILLLAALAAGFVYGGPRGRRLAVRVPRGAGRRRRAVSERTWSTAAPTVAGFRRPRARS